MFLFTVSAFLYTALSMRAKGLPEAASMVRCRYGMVKLLR